MRQSIIKNLKYRGLLHSIVLFIFIFFINQYNIHAVEKDKTLPKVSMGAGYSFGYYDVIHEYGDFLDWEDGTGNGGGIILESMLSNRFGLHSGIWFCQFSLRLEELDSNGEEGPGTSTSTSKTNILTMPFYLITSLFNFHRISLGLLSGFSFSYITESFLYYDSNRGSDGEGDSENITSAVTYTQIGIGGGIEIKIRLTRFIDYYVSCIGERYLSDFVSADEGSTDFLYDYRIIVGILLRTF